MTHTLSSPTANAAIGNAESNYATNLAALATLQPGIVERLAGVEIEVQWIFARDGSLTAMQPGERWWGDCSLPRRAGEFMFKTMEIHGVVACFLNPIHAAHLRVTLDLLEPQQAIVAIVRDRQAVWVILHCEDFSADIRSHRLWFVTGDGWESDLASLFVGNPGLPTPSQFIRAISTDNGPADALIGPAQKIFAEESNRRGAEVQSVRAKWTRPAKGVQKLCVVAPSRFRLWNDAPTILSAVTGEAFPTCTFDSDDPASASPFALARIASDCDAVIAANLSRADLAGILPDEMRLITWVTLGRIPTRDSCGKLDRLLAADDEWLTQARSLGWKESETRITAWPMVQVPRRDDRGFIALIADTRPLDPPKNLSDFSSHLLLWELIQNELPADPFLAAAGAQRYLDDCIARLRVAEESLNKTFFIEQLIVPAYQQGLARLLIEQNLPLRLFGKGWEKIPFFADHAGGPIESREQFEQVVAASSALVHAWPFGTAHPIDATGRPVLRAFGQSRDTFLRDPACSAAQVGAPTLSVELIRSLLA